MINLRECKKELFDYVKQLNAVEESISETYALMFELTNNGVHNQADYDALCDVLGDLHETGAELQQEMKVLAKYIDTAEVKS